MRKTATLSVLLVALVAFMMALAPVSQGAVLGSGQDRYVEVELSDGENYNSTLNMTVPEEISENHTLNGEIQYEVINGSISSYETTNYINLTFTNSTGSTWDFNTSTTISTNGTVEVEVDTNLPQDDENYTLSLTFENDDGQSASESLDVVVLSNTSYMIDNMIMPLIVVSMIIMISATFLKKMTNMFEF